MTETGPDTLVEIKDLRTYFYLAEGVRRAVEGGDLTINRGRAVGVVGESGCGKSITSLSLLLLVPHPGRIVSGEILFYKSIQRRGTTETVDVVNITALGPNSKEIR